MLTVLIVLVLLVVAVAALWFSVDRAEAADRLVTAQDPDGWRDRSEALRRAAADLSDAVSTRDRR